MMNGIKNFLMFIWGCSVMGSIWAIVDIPAGDSAKVLPALTVSVSFILMAVLIISFLVNHWDES